MRELGIVEIIADLNACRFGFVWDTWFAGFRYFGFGFLNLLDVQLWRTLSFGEWIAFGV